MNIIYRKTCISIGSLFLTFLTVFFLTNLTSFSVTSFSDNNTLPYVFSQNIGSFGTGDGQLKYPHSLDVDKFGFIYVTDTGNNRVEKFDQNGKMVLKWGD